MIKKRVTMMTIIPGEVLMDMKEKEEKRQKLRSERTSNLVLASHLLSLLMMRGMIMIIIQVYRCF